MVPAAVIRSTGVGLHGQDRRERRRQRREGSLAAMVTTVALPSPVGRSRVSPRSPHHRSNAAWACSGDTSSARVRHQRCAAV